MALPTVFDAYVAIDWSANSTPKTGADSIWVAWGKWNRGRFDHGGLTNPSTRGGASALIADILKQLVAGGSKVLAGFDFAYGYPSGLANALSPGSANPGWRAVWAELEHLIDDRSDNTNNRFQVASELNRRLGPPGPFWACPSSAATSALLIRKSDYPHKTPSGIALDEYRIVERHLRGGGRSVHSPWKLFTAGSVGSQALLGIPHLARLARDVSLHGRSWFWPFETGFRLPREASGPGVVHVEIWPGLSDVDMTRHRTKDAAQVLSIVETFANRDARASLVPLFTPAAVPPAYVSVCQDEEGWIFGA